MLSQKTYTQLTGLVVFIIGCVHLLRVFQGWVVVVNGWTVPTWVSIVGVIVGWYLAYNAYTLSQKKGKK